MRAQQRERAHRIRTTQLESYSLTSGQRIRNEEVTPEPIRQAQNCYNPKGQTRTDVARQPTDRRTESESDAERDADQAKRSSSLFSRRNVGDVRHGSGNA